MGERVRSVIVGRLFQFLEAKRCDHVHAVGNKRHVLSDWDLDTAQRAEVLRLTRAGFERLAPVRA